jgi:hypothetical protein
VILPAGSVAGRTLVGNGPVSGGQVTPPHPGAVNRRETYSGSWVGSSDSIGRPSSSTSQCSVASKVSITVCPNDVQIPQAVVDEALLDAIARALDERVVEAAVDEALYQLRSGQEQKLDRQAAVERELSLIEGRQRNLIEAIKHGQPVESLVVALKAEEDRKKVLAAELNALGDLAKVISLDAHRIKKDVTARAADVRGLLGRRGPQARQLLRKLVVDRLDCQPYEEGDRRGYRVSGRGTYARLLPGGVCATSIGGSNGIRTRVSALRGPCPGQYWR